MHIDYKVPKEEKDFLLANCPLKINKKSFKKVYFFTVAKELKTKREILFYKFRQNYPKAEEIGNLIILASGLDTDVLVAFTNEKSIELAQVFGWLTKKHKKQFILK